MEAGVPVFVGPEGEGKGGEVVDGGNGVAVFAEVDGAEVGAAGIAGFGADVGELFGDEDREFGFVGFAAVRAEDAAERPFGGAEGAEEGTSGTVALGTEDTEKRESAAHRAEIGNGRSGRDCGLGGEKSGVGLEEGAREKFGDR